MYTKLEKIHEEHKPIEGEHFPFSLQDLKHLSTSDSLNEITGNLGTYCRANKADELIKDLRKNPPKESCEIQPFISVHHLKNIWLWVL